MADEPGPTPAERVEMTAAARDHARVYQVAQGHIYVDAGQARSTAQRMASMPLRQSVDQLTTMSPDDAARVLAEMDEPAAARRLAALPLDRCAALLGGMDEELAAARLLLLPRELTLRVLVTMPVARAAVVLAETTPTQARGLLDDLPSDHAATLLAEMPDDSLTAILRTERWITLGRRLAGLPPARVMALRVPGLDEMDRSTDSETHSWAGAMKRIIADAPARMAAELSAMPDDRAVAALRALPDDQAARVIGRTDPARAAALLSSLPSPQVARLLGNDLPAGAILARMTPERVAEVLAEMPPGRADHLGEAARIGRLPPPAAAAALPASAITSGAAWLESSLGTGWLLSLLPFLEPERAAAVLSPRIPTHVVPPAVVAAIDALPTPHQAAVLAWLPARQAALVAASLDDERVRLLLGEMPARWAAVLAAGIPLRRRRALLDSLPKHIRKPLMDAAKAAGTTL
ncbi:magnesium transporter MgtE N-terminal domain-containing protein [Micromonospora sp. NPDC049282]|uniref:magnesium transporter MgtE N-terminal domain-containing protein n=1 Tax=Micromonospora sp. NPDC049282 TaxID=3364269 RepID=UPI00371407DA